MLSGIGHIAVLFGWLGLAYLVVVHFVYRPKSAFVTAHTKQGLGLWLGYRLIGWAISLVLAPLFGLGMLGGLGGFGATGHPGALIGVGIAGMILGLLALAAFIGALVLVIMGASRGFKGEEYRYPIIGDFVAQVGE